MSFQEIYKVCIIASRGISNEELTSKFLNRISSSKEEYKILVSSYNTLYSVEDHVKLEFWIFPYESIMNISNWEEFAWTHIKDSKGLVVVYDITKTETLDWILIKIHKIKNSLDDIPPILLVGNKLELKKNRQISAKQIRLIKESNDIFYSEEISLNSGENIEKMFMKLTKMMVRKTKPDSNIEIKRFTNKKEKLYLSLLIAVSIGGVSLIVSLIMYFVILFS
ncbi:hypothetical protein LCGC14_0614470 [marine sediment metagenome]|uniref:Uncharacterized protein n=1 Tax=marine sediment metagenome TaxID=412755 RepID=A0A0F9RBN2_9ZZZZ